MITFLFILGLAALLIVGGMKGSLRLRTHRVSTRQRLRGLRRSYAAPTGYKTTADSNPTESEMTRYIRKVLVILILILAMLSVFIIHASGAFVH